jgi:hypothetical protein
MLARSSSGLLRLPVLLCIGRKFGMRWKDSEYAQSLVKSAKERRKHAHVGRVNEIERFSLFDSLGADTCDGSGIARYDHMLHKIELKLGMRKTNFESPNQTRHLF